MLFHLQLTALTLEGYNFKISTAMLWTQKLINLYLDSTRAYQKLYYTNSYHLQFFLGECVTIMHNKMDLVKIVSFIFLHKRK